MGSFSWLFADTNNTKTSALTAGVTLRVPTGHSSANHAMKPTVSSMARISTTWS